MPQATIVTRLICDRSASGIGSVTLPSSRCRYEPQSLGNDDWLLVNLLEHVVAVIALGDQLAGDAGDGDRPLDGRVVAVEHLRAVAGADHPVAFVEIGDALGQRRERQRVGAEIGLALAMADDQRRAEPRADDKLGMLAEQDRQRKGAVKPRQHLAHRVGGGHAGLHLLADQMRDDLGIGLAAEGAAARDQFVAQRLEVFDDAVVDHRHLAGRVRMGVVGGRAAMRRPAGMGDAGAPG